MSWDVSVVKFVNSYRSVSEVPDDALTVKLGTRAEVHAAISEVFSGVDWSDPHWGIYDSDGGSIEFNNGGEEPLDGFMMHVRAGDREVALIVELCRRNGWSAIDCSTGDFLEQSSDPSRGERAWRAFRDQVLGDRK